jgi:hypothetical protein
MYLTLTVKTESGDKRSRTLHGKNNNSDSNYNVEAKYPKRTLHKSQRHSNQYHRSFARRASNLAMYLKLPVYTESGDKRSRTLLGKKEQQRIERRCRSNMWTGIFSNGLQRVATTMQLVRDNKNNDNNNKQHNRCCICVCTTAEPNTVPEYKSQLSTDGRPHQRCPLTQQAGP